MQGKQLDSMRRRFYSQVRSVGRRKIFGQARLTIISLLLVLGAGIILVPHISQAAGASPSVRDVSVATVTYTDPNKVIAAPTTQEGDLLVMVFATDYGTIGAMALPAGFTEVSRLDLGSSRSHLMVGTKVATASEPSSYTYTVPAEADSRVDLFSIQDADTSSPVAVTNAITPTSTTTHDAPSVTPLGGSDLLLSSVTLESGYVSGPIQPGETTWTPPADMTELTDAQTASTVITMTTAAKTLSSGGATGVKTFTATNPNSSRGLAFSIAIPGLSDVKTTIVPDSTTLSGTAWTASGNHTAIDEGSTTTSDYVGTGINGANGDTITFGLQNIPNITQATSVDFNFCAYSASDANGRTLDTLAANIKINNVTQTALTVTPAYSAAGSCTWYRVVYGSASWLQADIDSLQATFTRNVLGSGNSPDDDVRIVSAYARVTYTSPPAVATVSQAAYRWLANDFKGNGTFATRVDYSVGDNPLGIADADFNGDQITDLVVANNLTDTVSILLGSGNGTFATKVDYPTSDSPVAIAPADFNGDQIIDLAVSNQLTDNVSILLGNGNGTFAAKVDYMVGDVPFGIISADFNGDQIMDIATTNNADDNVSILLGNGNGTFATKVDYVAGNGAQDITSADFNSDQIVDLAIVNNFSDNVSILLGNGNGTFATKVDYSTSDSPQDITSADFNGDQIMDLAVSNQVTDNVSILLGSGSGTFASKVDYPAGDGAQDITSADFNGDQIIDLAMSNQITDSVSILLGNGNGTFTAKIDYAVGDTPLGITNADFNGDKIIDLAVSNQLTDSVSVLRGNAGPPQTALAAKDTPATAPEAGKPFRLRVNLGVADGNLNATVSYKIRYQQKIGGTCSTSPSAYADVTATTPIKFYNNTSLADGSAYISSALDPIRSGVTSVGQTYKETNPFSTITTVTSGQDGLWDIALAVDSVAASANYCLLVTKSDDTPLDAYAVIPEIIVTGATVEQSSYRLYQNADAPAPGSPLAVQNTPGSIMPGDSFRVRQLLAQTGGTTATTTTFKLQAAEKISTCNEASYNSTSIGVKFTNNASIADEAPIGAVVTDPTPASGVVRLQTYTEDAVLSTPTAIQSGEYGLWDFSLKADASLEGKTYCFRIVNADDTPLANYAYYPEVSFTPTLNQQMRGGQSVISGIKRPFNW